MAKTRMCILYGSQTGTAQDVAEFIWRESKKFAFSGPVLSLDEYNFKKLIDERLVIFVCSTTGQGNEPDNMKIFWRFLLRRDLPRNSLSELHFAVLGLGDSSYTKFNYVAKRLHKRLLQLSARVIIPPGFCDDQHDFGPSAIYLPWIKDLWNALSKQYVMQVNENLQKAPQFKWFTEICQGRNEADVSLLQWPSRDVPFSTELIENKRVTAEDHFQDVRLISFVFDNLTWKPGDVLVLRPWNCDESIEKLFNLFEEQKLPFHRNTVIKCSQTDEGEMLIPNYFEKSITLELVAKYIWDLNAIPRQRVFELLTLNCDNELEKEKLLELSQPEGLEEMINYAIRPKRTILEMLYDFPHAVTKLTINVLFEMFPVIKPRYFSIASIPETGSLQILVAIVEYKTILSVPRKGLCSSWLKNLHSGQKIFASIQKGTMKIPEYSHIPLIMVGPGTGIAPFRSLILERELRNENMKNIFIFFGCRSQYKDFYFKEDFYRLEKKQIIKCFFAFSRDQLEKRYVQHVIEEQGLQLKEAIIKGGFIFVAGNSKNMPNQVKDTFSKIFENDSYIEIMIKEGRYQEETW